MNIRNGKCKEDIVSLTGRPLARLQLSSTHIPSLTGRPLSRNHRLYPSCIRHSAECPVRDEMWVETNISPPCSRRPVRNEMCYKNPALFIHPIYDIINFSELSS